MKEKVSSERKFILDAIAQEASRKRGNAQVEQYSNIVQYSVDELIRSNLRQLAQRRDRGGNEKEMMDYSVRMAEEAIHAEMTLRGAEFDSRKYTNQILKELAPIAKEMFDLGTELLHSRETERIGERESFHDEAHFPFEVVEIGLKGSIEGLIAAPTAEEFHLSLGSIDHFCKNDDKRFPLEIEIDKFLYIVDDDGSAFISTENFPDALISEARRYLIELCKQIYLT
jgi:hypothetical protein